MVDLLTREIAIPNFMTPTGRTLGTVPLENNPSMLVIQYVDGKPGGIPEELGGLWTGRRQAEEAIKGYLVKFWDNSDASKPRQAKVA